MSELRDDVKKLVEKIGITVNYGDPVVLGDEKLIPVSAVWFGFGGGSVPSQGAGDAEGPVEGHGFGGGGTSIPLGAYVSDEFGTRFRPNAIVLLVVALPVVSASGRAIARIVKALKK